MRTPIGRYGGMFKSLSAVDLGVAALKGLLDRTGLAPDAVQDVILGHCYPSSEAPAIGRVVALDAGLPVTVPGMQVDRRCGSGLQAVIQACLQVGSGDNDLVVAGGCESMSNVAFYSTDMRWGGARGGVKVHDGLARGRTTAGGRHYPVPGGMLETAENLRRQYGISRQEQDELAVASHQRAVAAQKDGILAEEIVPVTVPVRRQGEELIDTDEHPRADTSVESLGKLKPVLLSEDPDATVTAGNASGQNDAASMCVVTTPEKADEYGLTPLVRMVSWGQAGVAPNIMGIGPVPATAGRAGQGRPAAERHRRHRTQRSLCRAGACGDAGMELRRRRPRPDQRARLGNLAGPPGRRDRRPNAGHAGARTQPPPGALRAGDHVHRRRPGACRGLRTGRFGVNPLAGITVVEVSSFVAAPLCGMTLNQLGAQVIRVDPIGGASDAQRWPLTADGTSIYWTGLNKGKRSATIDLRSPDGQELVRRLIVEGDGIVVTNAVLPWLNYDALAAKRTDVIHVQLLGRGDGSTGVDYTVNAGIGYPLVTGPADHAGPINHVLPAWDVCCGLYAALAVVAAVRRRDQTGEGARISLALEDVALATAGNLGLLTEPQVIGTQRERLGNAIYGQYGQDFTSRDGVAFMVVLLTGRHFRDLVDVTGTGAAVAALAEALGADFAAEGDRYRYRDVLSGLFATWFGDHTADEITAALSGSTVLFERYRTFAEVVEDPKVTENPLFSSLHQPGLGDYLAPAMPVAFDGAHPASGPAPALGQDTADVLTEHLGLTAADIERLANAGTIGANL